MNNTYTTINYCKEKRPRFPLRYFHSFYLQKLTNQKVYKVMMQITDSISLGCFQNTSPSPIFAHNPVLLCFMPNKILTGHRFFMLSESFDLMP